MSVRITPPSSSLASNTIAASTSVVSQVIAQQPPDIRQLNEKFIVEDRPHALLITNHGYPGPDVRWPKGGPDSGGQITYVNKVAECLVAQGFKVTVATRSFQPDEEYAAYGNRLGVAFFHGLPLARYVYVPGIERGFVFKEQLFAELPVIAHNLSLFIREEARLAQKHPWEYVAWINSHYWDAGVIGQHLVMNWWVEAAGCGAFKGSFESLNRHAWTSHSIGRLKQDNMDDEPPPNDEDAELTELRNNLRKWEYQAMNFPAREAVERGLIGGAIELYNGPHALYPGLPPAPVLAYTSIDIKRYTEQLGMPKSAILVRFPPGTDFNAYYPRASISDDDVQKLFAFLEDLLPHHLIARMKERPQSINVIVEASRMDATKRKEILIEAMSLMPDDTILLITGKPDKKGVFKSLKALIAERGLGDRAFLLGMVPDELMGPLMSLPHGERDDQFRLVIGAGASRMEGWGMAVMDMTAGGLPLVSSDRTPYATHLREHGDAAIVIPLGANEPQRYADAFTKLIADPHQARQLAARGREAAREFDWPALVEAFVEAVNATFGLA